ncbi:Ms4533A family Cys-rich leader peptide [Actinacidiphila yeochonensis]|nr:Ms4533A family Cys-rich leader peptide [Actinacidiphila yeochonensis]
MSVRRLSSATRVAFELALIGVAAHSVSDVHCR